MQILLRSARIVDPQSPFDGQVTDLLLENGLIRQIGENLTASENIRVIEHENLHVSPGWVDLRVAGKDPGFEHKEDLDSVCVVAAAGGFTDIALLPNTLPAVDNKSTLGYIRRMTEGHPVTVYPIAAITKGAKGEDFTDMIDLHHAGAVAFSDGDHPLQNADLLVKTLQYLKPFNGLLMNRPEEKMLTRFGQMHEGVQSTLLGLKGLPALAEELIVDRDLRLLDYALGKDPVSAPVLHFSTISSARSVELIRRAKAQGLPVSCDVAVHQLVFDDSALATFDTNLKVDPPFRSKADVQALWYGLADGTIDTIVSDHNPQDDESKNIEFDLADFGITGLETLFGALVSHNQGLSLGQIVHKLSVRPRQILRLLPVTIDQGQAATLTIFNPERSWTFAQTLSKSKNSPFLGKTLTGAVLGIINKGQFVQNAGI
ncbi:dihydroorotase [Arsenicibacter rosenii]|uniref:Dihydroorotase n=1 Tax=Arsenicibacter rosenii TaxID=1750698 RepID=A0A1S2VFX3_9BACT|nr:dihydroorotase [Arsenicibacter rosenii]OIN57651.1 dihydroorotase [Arsenicibacter rosenii]